MANLAKIRNRCRKQLKPGVWYSQKFVAEVLGDDTLSFEDTVNTLKQVAEYQCNGSNRGKNICFLSIKEPKVYKRLTSEQKELKRQQKEIKASVPELITIQYTKCIRLLIEKHQEHHYEDLNYTTLSAIYLQKPIENFFLGVPQFDDCLRRTLYSRISWDMHHIAQTSDTAIKKQILKSHETNKSFRANEEQTKEINRIFRGEGIGFAQGVMPNAQVYSSAVSKINAYLQSSSYVCSAFCIKYKSKFPHKEIYTVDIAKSKILRAWAKAVQKEIENIVNREVRNHCKELYLQWENKYITPLLIPDDKVEIRRKKKVV